MIKGVNRQIVEIAQPESRYFERIILFVKPEFSGLTEAELTRRAGKDLPPEAAPPRSRKRRRAPSLGALLRAALCAGAGAGLMALLELLMRS